MSRSTICCCTADNLADGCSVHGGRGGMYAGPEGALKGWRAAIDRRGADAARELPPRGEFIVQGAAVVTMDPALGDFDFADIHARDGSIIAVGQEVSAPGAEVIGGRGLIALPGFVDTHWHLWNSVFRGLVGFYSPKLTYFPLKALLGPLYTPEDMYRAVRLGLAGAVSAGITTVHNWAHNIVGPEHADANILAQLETGLRGRFSYGWAEGQSDEQPMDLADLERVQREWLRDPHDLLTLGVAIRGSEGPPSSERRNVYLREFAAARRLNLPITAHVAQRRESAAKSRAISAFARDRLLGPDVQLVHAIHATEEERQAMAETGTHLSLSPLSALQVGMGFPQTTEMLAAGVLVSLSIDTVAVAGADMFATMKLVLDVEHARFENNELPAHRVLQMATIDGARDLGIDDRVGSLTPGKRADIILVRTDHINMSTLPAADWARLLVQHAHPGNVDTVVVDGRILKRDGRLVALDEQQIVHDATVSAQALVSRAGLTSRVKEKLP